MLIMENDDNFKVQKGLEKIYAFAVGSCNYEIFLSIFFSSDR